MTRLGAALRAAGIIAGMSFAADVHLRVPPWRWRPWSCWSRGVATVDGERMRVLVGIVDGFKD